MYAKPIISAVNIHIYISVWQSAAHTMLNDTEQKLAQIHKELAVLYQKLKALKSQGEDPAAVREANLIEQELQRLMSQLTAIENAVKDAQVQPPREA